MDKEGKDESAPSAEEEIPIDKSLKVLDYVTISKTNRWWQAVALIESFGRNQIALYLWQNKNGKWARKQKFVVQSQAQWEGIAEGIEKFVSALRSTRK